MMAKTISETAVTSKTKVLAVDAENISPLYYNQIDFDDHSFQRINFPADYGIRLGCNFRRFLFCHRDEKTLVFSMTQLTDLINGTSVRGFLYKESGYPKTTQLDPDDDAIFFLVPKHLSTFEIGDEIIMEFDEGGLDRERRVICQKL